MSAYISPAGIEATPERVIEAAGKYETFAQLPIYSDLNRHVKRAAGSLSIGAVLDMTLDELQSAGQENNDFQKLVDGLITAYEEVHPEKVNQKDVLADTLAKMAESLRFDCGHDHTSDHPAPDQADIDAQFADIIGGFSEAKTETDK